MDQYQRVLAHQALAIQQGFSGTIRGSLQGLLCLLLVLVFFPVCPWQAEAHAQEHDSGHRPRLCEVLHVPMLVWTLQLVDCTKVYESLAMNMACLLLSRWQA